MRFYRVVCQGCNRFSRIGLSLSDAIEKAREDGWETSTDHGQPSAQSWCRRCSSLIVEYDNLLAPSLPR
jgi:hypothetical protein